MKKLTLAILILSVLLATFASCSGAGNMEGNIGNLAPEYNVAAGADEVNPDTPNGSATFAENPFIATAEEPISTFSADVDTASYSYFRKLVTNNYDLEYLKQNGANFRTEEFINYFKYQANAPQNGELFGVTAAITQCPWNPNTKLMQLTLQAEQASPIAGNNLVFLVDVSGSMYAPDKLPLLKTAFSYLIQNLTENDRVSIVTYSGAERVVLAGCVGNQHERILEALNSLEASGSTNGEAGLKRAYQVAQDNMIVGGNNRIILASDGDLNVGISSADELKAFVEGKRDAGIYLSVLGFGTGNYRDGNMEALADNGNGVYYYIDGESEAEKVFGTDLTSTLNTIAKDVKLQITFDPAAVSSYRLIGYENRILSTEDFDDDKKDAGEVGAGHQVTVCYELTLTANAAEQDAWMALDVRYKPFGDEASVENNYSIGRSSVKEADADLLFLSALIETAMVLHNSSYLGDINLSHVLSILDSMDLSASPDRAEFRELVRKIG